MRIVGEQTLRKLEKDVKVCLKSNGCIRAVHVKDRTVPCYDAWVSEPDVVVYVSNSHNSYLPDDLLIFKKVAKILIDNNYEIETAYPCYIYVKNKIDWF